MQMWLFCCFWCLLVNAQYGTILRVQGCVVVRSDLRAECRIIILLYNNVHKYNIYYYGYCTLLHIIMYQFEIVDKALIRVSEWSVSEWVSEWVSRQSIFNFDRSRLSLFSFVRVARSSRNKKKNRGSHFSGWWSDEFIHNLTWLKSDYSTPGYGRTLLLKHINRRTVRTFLKLLQ